MVRHVLFVAIVGIGAAAPLGLRWRRWARADAGGIEGPQGLPDASRRKEEIRRKPTGELPENGRGSG